MNRLEDWFATHNVSRKIGHGTRTRRSRDADQWLPSPAWRSP